ncbi:unnamed protein product [Thlaspi arvense]|uniref:DUF4219 domain-containing protein n=1 Tax=Thlaspi arvense TaxID=13288 RepID=A0AAU9S0P3_THLAR|nr:unnamed protein product [Thlaspi arvense]
MAAANTPYLVSDDFNYEIWAPIVKATLVEKGLWNVVENGIQPDRRNLVVKDKEALEVLRSSLPDSAFRTTLWASSSSAKDL